MIKKKPSDARWIVPVCDPAILPAGERAINQYTIDRDVEKLGVDVKQAVFKDTGELVTLYKVRPLSNDHYHLVEMGVGAFQEIFRTHVVDAKNANGLRVTMLDGKSTISDSFLNEIDGDTLTDVVGVIIELGQGRDGEDRAFFAGDSSRRQRLRSLRLRANLARIESAKSTPSDTSSDDQNQKTENTQN